MSVSFAQLDGNVPDVCAQPMLNDLVDRLGWRRSSNPATRPNEFDAIFPLEKNDAVSSPPVDIRRDVDSILRDIRRCRASEATSAT